MKRIAIHRAAAALVAALALPTLLAAQASSHAPTGGGRSLGGHTFIPLSVVPQPFVGTSFGTTIGGAMAFDLVEAIIVDVGGVQDTLLPSGDLVFGAFELALQQNLSRRFALRAGASINVRAGTNARILFAEGLSGLAGFGIGGLATLHRGERSMITASLDYRRGNLTELTPQEFAEYVGEWGIDSIDHWGEHLLEERRNSRVVGGARGAWALKPWFGISGVVEAGPADLFEAGSNLALTLGLGGSLDFGRMGRRVPIGLGLGLGRTTSPTRTDDIFGTVTSVNVAVFYTGREDFAVGLDTQWSKAKLIAVNESVLSAAFRFVLRYDF